MLIKDAPEVLVVYFSLQPLVPNVTWLVNRGVRFGTVVLLLILDDTQTSVGCVHS